MANNLFPVYDVPATLAENSPVKQRYQPVPQWDMEEGEFVMDGAKRLAYGSGYDAWVLWCIKTMLTQRWAHGGYSSNAGIEAEQAFRLPDRPAQESAFRRTITEALMADPMGRTAQVGEFQFAWGVDALNITCTVTGKGGNTAAITASLKR